MAALQPLRHTSLLDHPCQAPDKGCLADARLAYMQRIVLVAAAQHLHRPGEFLLTTYQRIVFLIEVVHAGHQPSPGCLVLPLARLLFQMVVELIGTDQLAHEVALLVAQCLLQQITGPRLLQMQDAHHQMGQIQRLCTAVHHLLAGELDHLSHLRRGLGIVGLTLGHRLEVLQLLLQTLNNHLWRIEVVQGTIEVELIHQHKQQVLRHHELMSVFLAARHRLSQHFRRAFRLFDLCHNAYSFSGSTVRRSGKPASRAMSVAFLTFETATS